jgi:hypothetical protein
MFSVFHRPEGPQGRQQQDLQDFDTFVPDALEQFLGKVKSAVGAAAGRFFGVRSGTFPYVPIRAVYIGRQRHFPQLIQDGFKQAFKLKPP